MGMTEVSEEVHNPFSKVGKYKKVVVKVRDRRILFC